jgi:hypothetical protein
MLPELIDNQVGMNNAAITATPAIAARFGLPLTSFADWVNRRFRSAADAPGPAR